MDISQEALAELRNIIAGQEPDTSDDVPNKPGPQRNRERRTQTPENTSDLPSLWDLFKWAYNLCGWLSLIFAIWLLLGANPFGIYPAVWALKWAFFKWLLGHGQEEAQSRTSEEETNQ